MTGTKEASAAFPAAEEDPAMPEGDGLGDGREGAACTRELLLASRPRLTQTKTASLRPPRSHLRTWGRMPACGLSITSPPDCVGQGSANSHEQV